MKNLLKRSLSVLLTLTIIFSSAYVGLEEINFSGLFVVKARAWSEGDLNFTKNDVDDKSFIVFYCNRSATGEIVIPETFKGLPVTGISAMAFYECKNLTSITIPDSVTTIGNDAFNGCTSLKSIIIPDSVTSIEEYAFRNCTSLTSISISDNVTSIETGVFGNCSSLASITIPRNVTTIGYGAFRGCTSLKSITIPSGVTSIDDYAFYNCTSLTSIAIPDGVTSIAEETFYSCTSLTSITIPDGVTSIGERTFCNCTSLTSITIPDSVTSIGEETFDNCTSLESVIIPDSVISIGLCTFQNCTSLTSITIPNGVTSIGNFAFDCCKSLASITIPDSVTSIGIGAFNNCKSLTSITIPDSVTNIGCEAFYSCTSLTSVKLGNGVTSIDEELFEDCISLTSVNFGNSVTTIGKDAFSGCTSLTSITIPDSVTSIGDLAFYNCTSLTSITIPVSVKSIGDAVCAFSSSLTDVYYSGTKEQWNEITIGSNNDSLNSANIIFNSSGNSDDSKPDETPITESNGNFSVVQKYGGATSHKYDYTYKDAYFNKTATEYNHELATMSLCLALSTFHLENKNIKKAYKNVSSLLEKCGFKAEDGEPYNYSVETTPDNVGCFISQKKIGNTTLIAVAVRSGGYGSEWASNFTVGYNGDHQGFNQAADIVLERIENYIKDHEITGNVKFWITGYSRGAATATQTAAKLNYTSIDGVNFTKNQIYAYGFATPAGAIEDSDPTNLDKYGNIFNIINFHDLVPKVAPEKWNFGRYGTTYYLPFKENSWAATEKSEKNVKSWFTKENLDYKIDDFIPVYSDIPGFPLPISNDTLGVFSNKLINDIAKSIGSRALYTLNLQNSVRAIWTKNVDITLPLALVEILVVVGSECEAQPQYLTTAIGANTLLVEAHSAFGAYYMGWMKTIPADSALEYLNNGDMRHWLFNCPVDVYVYDTDGKLVAAIEDDTVVEIENSTFSYGVDENGQKYFYLPVDDEYDIKVKAREDCETTCTVNEFSGGSFNESRVVTFTEIPMEKNEELSVSTEAYSEDDITEGTENGSSADYTIQRENEQVIEADVDITGEDIENYTYNVTVECDETKGTVYGGGSFTIGQFCQLSATNKPGHRFSKWTVNGETVSTDSTYRFAVKEDVTIVAEYVPCEHPVYIEDVIEPTCTEDGYTKHTCDVCTYNYNDTMVKAKGHKSSSWITDKKATVYKAGSKHKECTECKEVLKTATIKQLKCSKPKLKTIANTATGVKLTWGKVSGADSYEVYRKVKGGSYSKVGTTSKTYFTDKKAKSGKQYYYVVKAVNEAGKSANSSYKTIKYLADPTLKTPISAKKGITLKWSKVTGAQGYVVYRKTGNGSFTKIATVKGVSKISYVDKSTKKGKKYTYKVKAYYGKTYSAYSNAKSITDKY